MTKIKFIAPVLALVTFSSGAIAQQHEHHAHTGTHSTKSKADTSYFGFDTGYGYGAYGQHFRGTDTDGNDEITVDTTDFDFEKTSSTNQSIFYGYHVSNDFRLELSLNNHQYREKLYTTSSTTSTSSTTESGESEVYSLNTFIDGGIVDLIISGYFDFNTGEAWTPYVGLGIGYGSAHYKEYLGAYLTDLAETNDSDTSNYNDSINYENVGRVDKGLFTYQAALGVKFDMTPSTTFDIGYKYHGATIKEMTAVAEADQSEYTHSFKFRPGSHILSLGATYRF